MTAIVAGLLLLFIDIIKDALKLFGDSLLKSCSPNLDTFLQIFPYIEDYNDMVIALAMILSGGLFLFSLYSAMLKKEGESPLKIVIRGFASVGLVLAIKDILLMILGLVDGLYNTILSDTALALGDMNIVGQNNVGSEVFNHAIELAILVAIGYQLLGLIMEIAERYVIMCVLFFLSPLAAACVAAESLKKTIESFFHMFITAILMLFLNVFFLGTFFKSFSDSVNSLTDLSFNDSTSSSSSLGSLIILVLFHIAFLKVAREIDSHLKGMGLSTAQTGKGLWGEILAGATAMKSLPSIVQSTGKTIKGAGEATLKAPGAIAKGVGVVGNGVSTVARSATNKIAPNSSGTNWLNSHHDKSSAKQAVKTATNALNNPAASVGGKVAQTAASALMPELSGAGLVGASIAGGVLASTITNADGSTTNARYSKEKTNNSVPVTGSDGNTYYRSAENENGGPIFGYGAPVGQSAPLSSRFSNDDIQKMGFGENATLTNNGDGSLAVTGEDGSRLGTLFSPSAYKNSQEGAGSIHTSDGDTWGLYTSGSFGPSLDNGSLMSFVSESSPLGSIDPITSIDTSNYASTGTLTATRRSGMTDTINSSNASSYFGGYSIDEVASASGTSWSDYETATNKTVSSVDTSTASKGYSTVTNTDGSQTRVYDSSRWSTRDRYADYFSQGNVSFFTEEGTRKVSVENGTKKETNVFSKARKRK